MAAASINLVTINLARFRGATISPVTIKRGTINLAMGNLAMGNPAMGNRNATGKLAKGNSVTATTGESAMAGIVTKAATETIEIGTQPIATIAQETPFNARRAAKTAMSGPEKKDPEMRGRAGRIVIGIATSAAMPNRAPSVPILWRWSSRRQRP